MTPVHVNPHDEIQLFEFRTEAHGFGLQLVARATWFAIQQLIRGR